MLSFGDFLSFDMLDETEKEPLYQILSKIEHYYLKSEAKEYECYFSVIISHGFINQK